MQYSYILLLFALSVAVNANTIPNTNDNNAQQKSNINNVLPAHNIVQILDNYFSNLKSFKASFVQQLREIQNNKIEKCEGTINISRDTKNHKMEIKYKNGKIQEIYMEGRYISVVNRKAKKKRTYSILTTPLYALLSGNMKISELKPNIIIHKDDITVNIISDKQNITLVLSTKNNKNNELSINKLLAWTIEDGKTIINVGFDSKNYFVNDKQIVESINTNKNVPN